MRNPHKCNHLNCTESFKWPMQLNRHKKKCRHKPPDIKYVKTDDGFKCNVCSRIFKHQSGVSKHIKKNKCKSTNTAATAATASKSYVCSTCGKEFAHQCRLNQHMKSHADSADGKKVCPCCNKQFKRIDWYQKHVETCMDNTDAEPTASEDDSSIDGCSMVAHKADSLLSPQNSLEIDPIYWDTYDENSNIDFSGGPIFHNSTFTSPPPLEVTHHQEPEAVQQEAEAFPNQESIDGIIIELTDDSRTEYYREHKANARKKKRLESICDNLSSPARAKVVKDLVRGTPRVLNEIYSEGESRFETEAMASVVNHLKSLSSKKMYGAFYKLLDECFGDKLNDEAFSSWLIHKKLGLRIGRFLPRLSAWRERDFKDTRGRARLAPEVIEKVYATFVENSVTSTDGRNGRNMVLIREQRYYEIYDNFIEHSDIKIEEKEVRKREYFQSNRRILTCTVMEIRHKLQSEGLSISMGKLIELKPFFIAYPTDKELALCLCKICLNCRLLLDALIAQAKKDGEELADSVTGFLMESCPCDKAENGYYQWKCVKGKCKSCKLIKPTKLKCSTSQEQVQVSQFETTKTPYKKLNKKTGKQEDKISEKTERVISTRNVSDVYSSLAAKKTKYVMHRYQVANDKYQWPKIASTTDSYGPIYHFDYSENLSQSYKFEPQSSHFNKQQYSLHCTVKHLPNSEHEYIYHFSDSKKHDFAFTSSVVDHLVELEDEDFTSTIIRVKSDNCSCQYKCRYVFAFYRNLAKQLDKTVIAYYGVCGHGKGLVDAMSAFGVKTPLRRAVVTEDLKYSSAQDICDFLIKKFSDQFPEKQYYVIDKAALDARRENKEELKIKDCNAQHMFSYLPNGQVQSKANICSCDKCLKGDFINCTIEKGKIVEEGEDDDEDDDLEYEKEDLSDEAHDDDLLEVIDAGNVIALLTEDDYPFYLCQVIDYGIALEDLGCCENDNFVCKGEKFIACFYFDLDKSRKKKGKVYFKLLDDDIVYVNPATVFAIGVNMDMDDLSLSSEGYQWLCDNN